MPATPWAVSRPLGKRVVYVLFFIHMDSREVFVSSSTYPPDTEWIQQQQARNVTMAGSVGPVRRMRLLMCTIALGATGLDDVRFLSLF